MFDDNTPPFGPTLFERVFFVVALIFLTLGSVFFAEAIYSKAFASEVPTVNLCTGGEGKPGIVAEFGD